MKPNSHFLRHYPEMRKRFSPPLQTVRFETKHQYFKRGLTKKFHHA